MVSPSAKRFLASAAVSSARRTVSASRSKAMAIQTGNHAGACLGSRDEALDQHIFLGRVGICAGRPHPAQGANALGGREAAVGALTHEPATGLESDLRRRFRV